MPSRAELRRRLRRARQALTDAEQDDHALRAARHFFTSKALLKASRIAAYVAQDGELDPAPLINRLLDAGKCVALPVVAGLRELYFYRYRRHTPMVVNRFGIPEPDPVRARFVTTSSLNLVLVPLVGFDALGNRLGMGGGFYDATFARHRHKPHAGPCLLGFAHALAAVETLEAARWDTPLDAVLTENGIMTFTQRGKHLLGQSKR